MLFALLIAFILILVNALYVAAEFGSVAVRRAQVAQSAEQGDKKAKWLLPFVQEAPKLDTYVAACQIGITASSLILGAFADAAFSPHLARFLSLRLGMFEVAAYSVSAVAVLVVLTGLQVLFGELVPKSLALRFPLPTALATVRPMAWSLSLYGPFIRVLNGSAILLLRLFKLPLTAHRHIHSPKEIESILLQSARSGIFGPEQYQRLREAMRLPLRKAHQLMMPRTRVDAVDNTWPLSRSIEAIVRSPYTRLPVYENDRSTVLGFVHSKEVAARCAAGNLQSIKELLRPAPIIPETISVDRLIELLRKKPFHIAFVVDEQGDFAGLISIEDILSELLGDIPDELKQPRLPDRLGPAVFRLPGEMRRDLVENWLGMEWPGESDTVSGHVVNLLGRIPKEGESVLIQGARVEVEAVKSNVITSVLVSLPEQGKTSGSGVPE